MDRGVLHQVRAGTNQDSESVGALQDGIFRHYRGGTGLTGNAFQDRWHGASYHHERACPKEMPAMRGS